MQTTNYTIKKVRETYEAKKDGVRISHGCLTENDALHSIWKHEGSNLSDYFILNEKNEVLRTTREN